MAQMVPQPPVPPTSQVPALPPQAKVGRWNKAAIEDRRRTIFEMVMLKGYSETAIATVLGIHRNTVVRDVAVIGEILQKRVEGCDPMSEIGVQAQKYLRSAELMLLEMGETKDAAKKAALMGRALQAMDLRVKMLLETGILPTAAQKVEVSGGLDLKGASMEELKSHRERLMERLAATGAPRLNRLGMDGSGN